MFARFKGIFLYVGVPLAIIICTNLIGLLSPIIVYLFALASDFIHILIFEYWYICLLCFIILIVIPRSVHAEMHNIVQNMLKMIRRVMKYSKSPKKVPNTHYKHRSNPLPFVSKRPFVVATQMSHSYSFSTHASTGRDDKPPRRTLTIIAAVILFCIALVSVVVLSGIAYDIASVVYTLQIFKRYNIVVALVFVLVLHLFILRRHILSPLTWKKVSKFWVIFTPIGGTIGSLFWSIAQSDSSKNVLLKLDLKSEYSNLDIITPAIICFALFTTLTVLIGAAGLIISTNPHGNTPKGWFYTAFGFAILGNVTLYTLICDAIFLTAQTHYALHTLPTN